MAKKSKTLYDCILIKTATDAGLTKDQMIDAIQQLKNQELLAFDTGSYYNLHELCAQGFATIDLLEHMDFRIDNLLEHIFTRYNQNKFEPQEFNIVTITGHKFSVLIY